MNVLVVFCHPTRNSLNGAFLEKTLDGLKNNPKINQVELLDLYAEGFNPALVFNQNIRRRDLHLVEELQKYRDQIKWADRLVFIYPIWWGRPPAMLLGYFDRMMSSGFAFKDKEKGMLPEGLLKGKQVICLSTMKGPGLYLRLLLKNAHQVLMRRALFNFVGIRKVKFYEIGDMESKGVKQKKALEKMGTYFRKIA